MKPLQFAVGLLATLASCSLYAQSVTLRADIPFEFRVGEKLMPAGEYFVDDHDGMLRFQQKDGAYGAVSSLVMYGSGWPDQKPELRFSRYGDAYFLREVSDSVFTARAFGKTSYEKELARRSNPSTATVAIKGK